MRELAARLRARIKVIGVSALGGLRSAVRAAPGVGVQLVGLAGFAAFLEGVRRVFEPAAFILGGALVVAWAVLKSGGRRA